MVDDTKPIPPELPAPAPVAVAPHAPPYAPLDLEAARLAAALGPDGIGPYARSRKWRADYSEM